MSNFRRPGAGLDQEPGAHDEFLHYSDHDDDTSPGRAARASLSEHLGRVSRWFQGLDEDPDDGATVEWDPTFDPAPDELEPAAAGRVIRTGRLNRSERGSRPERRVGRELRPERRSRYEHAEAAPIDPGPDGVAPRFPLAPFGYNRVAVDEELAELERALAERERELIELREQEKPPLSINEEIERLGEQTASILVVAHDQAHETTRRAQEQAERCIADAAANAIDITSEAKARLRELDEETDAVWRERARLLEDTRTVSAHLATLVQEAEARFPADAEKAGSPMPAMQPPVTHPPAAEAGQDATPAGE